MYEIDEFDKKFEEIDGNIDELSKLVADVADGLSNKIESIDSKISEVDTLINSVPSIIQEEISNIKIPQPLNGKDGKNGINGKDGKDGLNGADGKDGTDGLDGSPDTPLDIAKKLNTLENKIEWKILKDFDSLVNQDTLKRAIQTLENQTRFLIQRIDNSSGNATITATYIGYGDASNNLTGDSQATRDPITQETFILQTQNSGLDTAGFGLKHDIFGIPGTDGVGLLKSDDLGVVGSARWVLLDPQPLGAPTKYAVFGAVDDVALNMRTQFVQLASYAALGWTDGNDTASFSAVPQQTGLFADNFDGGGNDSVNLFVDLQAGGGSQFIQGRYLDGVNSYQFTFGQNGMVFDFGNGAPGTFYGLPLADGNNGDVLTTDGIGNVTWQPGGGAGYTVATLPAGVTGQTAYVTDALAPAWHVAVVGGGAVTTPVFYDGTNWIVI